jgi:hypothetical protein
MNLPVIGQIRTFEDVQRALNNIRSYFAAGGGSGSGGGTSYEVSSSRGIQGEPGPVGPQGPQGISVANLDGGSPTSTYGGIDPIDCGGVT